MGNANSHRDPDSIEIFPKDYEDFKRFMDEIMFSANNTGIQIRLPERVVTKPIAHYAHMHANVLPTRVNEVLLPNNLNAKVNPADYKSGHLFLRKNQKELHLEHLHSMGDYKIIKINDDDAMKVLKFIYNQIEK